MKNSIFVRVRTLLKSLQYYSKFCKGLHNLLPIMNITALTKERNRLFTVVVAFLGVFIAIGLTLAWPAPAMANNKVSPSPDPVIHLYAQNVPQDAAPVDLHGLLAKIVLTYQLRDILPRYGVTPEDEVTFSLAVQDAPPVTIPVMPARSRPVVEQSNKSLRDAILDDVIIPGNSNFQLISHFLAGNNLEMPSMAMLNDGAEPFIVRLTITLDVKDERSRPKFRTTMWAPCQYCRYYYWCDPFEVML